jgi:hypothetical protein
MNLLGTYTRQYYLKNCCGETNAPGGYLLSAVDYLDYWRQISPIPIGELGKIPVLDDKVYLYRYTPPGGRPDGSDDIFGLA